MSESPDWNLLPENPLKFFQLQQDCDQRALKRAYGKLIRQFKPEKFPEEFKKIRTAYEQLQEEIEYRNWEKEQDVTSKLEKEADKTSTDEENHSADNDETIIIRRPEPAPMNVSVEASWNERVEKEKPEKLYAELETKTPKQPDDYVKLAILSDLVIDPAETDEPPRFETWLLRGIEQTSDPHQLLQMLSSYIEKLPENRLADETELIQFLLQLAEIINTHRFFWVTFPLWHKLLREASFDTFRETLDRCEQILFDPREQDKLIFYVQILNAMQWKADETERLALSHGLPRRNIKQQIEWLEAKKEYLEAHYELLPFYNLDNIFDETDLIQQYHQNLGNFLNQDQAILRRRFHEMLRDYILNAPDIAHKKLLRFQLSVLQDDTEILKCFSSSHKNDKDFINLWAWMVNDCPGMNMEAETELEKMKAQADQLFRLCHRTQMPRKGPRYPGSRLQKWKKIFSPALLFVTIIAEIAFLFFLFIPPQTELETFKLLFFFATIPGATTLAYFAARYFLQKQLEKDSVQEKYFQDLYREYLQPHWIDFLANNHWQYESVMEIIKQEAENWPYKTITLFLKNIVRDTGAFIVAFARRSIP